MVEKRKSNIIVHLAAIVLVAVAIIGLHANQVFACEAWQAFQNGKCVNECANTQIYTTIDIGTKTPHCVDNPAGNTNLTQNPIYTWLIVIIQFASAGVGIAVVGGIVWGAILYLTARDNASQTQKAVSVIINSLIGLLLFLFMFAILNYLIPGGILT